jgi:hypothetical protein
MEQQEIVKATKEQLDDLRDIPKNHIEYLLKIYDNCDEEELKILSEENFTLNKNIDGDIFETHASSSDKDTFGENWFSDLNYYEIVDLINNLYSYTYDRVIEKLTEDIDLETDEFKTILETNTVEQQFKAKIVENLYNKCSLLELENLLKYTTIQ